MTIRSYDSIQFNCMVYRTTGRTRYLCIPPKHINNKSSNWKVRKAYFDRKTNRVVIKTINYFPTEEAAVMAITILLETQI